MREINRMADESQPGIRETTYKQPPTREPTPATEVDRVGVRNVEAETVIFNRGSAQSVNAARVTLDHAAARSVDAKSLQMDRSAAARVNSERVVLQGSSASQISARELRMVRSQAGVVVAREAHLEGSRVLLFAGRTSGEVSTVLTIPTAAALGAAVGAGMALMFALLRLAFRKG